ncbi:hypothetical protein P5P86_10410 [Nocardioides sp. BP30]|uniref:hypothetical protein n=1 Tax=Nocardioides sp. BP30 TaxID=3036374 RepID=UPI0024699E3D|nr:hypothetical protein [Nocardioides sp. BP30]WGL50380.1 hypothetical protein P5P86_10410 [Nocardioides sp. BP30]
MAHIARFHVPIREHRVPPGERHSIGTIVAGVVAMLALAGMVGGLLAAAAWAGSRLVLGVFS